MNETIKSFLVGLGFGLDDASYAAFNKTIASATLKVAALYASIKLSATGIFYAISRISEGFEQMGYEMRLVAPPITKVLQLRQEMMKAYSAAGINMRQAVQQSVQFNFSLAKTKYALDAIYKGVGIRFLPLLTKQMNIFRNQIYANMPKIQDSLVKFVQFIFKAFEATNILGTRVWSMLQRVYDFFKLLDDKTNGWSTLVLAAVAAWKLLNLSFLATPLGMLITGITTLLALWDDFKTFREGGQSLINWGSDTTKMIVGLVATVASIAAAMLAWKGIIIAVTGAMKAWSIIQELITVLVGLNKVLGITDLLALALEAPFLAIAAAIGAVVTALTLADAKWQIFGGHLSGFFSGIGAKIMDFVGGPNLSANLGASGGGAPLGSQSGMGAGAMQVSQETNINVQGGDATSTARQVAGHQDRVNADMTRNLKGATR